MDKHPTQWLPAYYDGELRGQRLRDVTAHLGTCDVCRRELAQMESLHALLQVSSAPLASARFQAEIGLRLPSRRAHSDVPRVFRWAGWLIPGILLGAALFAQTVGWLTNALLLIAATGWGQTWLAWLLPQSGGGVLTGWQSALHHAALLFWRGAVPAGLLVLALFMGLAWLIGMRTNALQLSIHSA